MTETKRRAEMSWLWNSSSRLYCVFIIRNEDGSFTVQYPIEPSLERAGFRGKIILPSFELAEKLACALVDVLRAAYGTSDAKVTNYDLRREPE